MLNNKLNEDPSSAPIITFTDEATYYSRAELIVEAFIIVIIKSAYCAIFGSSEYVTGDYLEYARKINCFVSF